MFRTCTQRASNTDTSVAPFDLDAGSWSGDAGWGEERESLPMRRSPRRLLWQFPLIQSAFPHWMRDPRRRAQPWAIFAPNHPLKVSPPHCRHKAENTQPRRTYLFPWGEGGVDASDVDHAMPGQHFVKFMLSLSGAPKCQNRHFQTIFHLQRPAFQCSLNRGNF